MQGIQQIYTQYFNKKYNATGHVFEQRYKSTPCSEESYLERLIAYIHYNPVDAKLVRTCDQYPWSGHNEIIHKVENPILDMENLIFTIGGTQVIQSYMDIIHNFSELKEDFVEKDIYHRIKLKKSWMIYFLRP